MVSHPPEQPDIFFGLFQFIVDRSPISLFLLRGRQITYLNARARTLFEENLVVGRRNSLLFFSDQEIDAALARVIASSDTISERCFSTITVEVDGSKWIVQATVLERGKPASGDDAAVPNVIIAVQPLAGDGAGRGAAIRNFVGLTAAERELLEALVQGESLKNYSRRKKISIHTVRWHVKNMIEKTSGGSIHNLVRLGSLMLPFD